MNQPFSGGWRFGGSNEALAPITNQGISPEFLKKVASLGLLGEQDKPALEKAVTPDALSGLLDSPGSGNWGGDYGTLGASSPFGGAMTTTEAGNAAREVSPAGLSASFNPSAKTGMAMMAGGPLAALMSSLQVQKTAPVYDLVMPGMNGFNRGDYGMSSTEIGPPNAAQAQAIADMFARDFAAYAQGGDSGFDSGVGGLGIGGSPDGYW